jgi:hypothetical protein
MEIHPPTKCCGGVIHDNEEDKQYLLIADPETGRGSVHSTNQTAKGRPEFLFLDTLGDTDAMVSCSRIITDYDRANEIPSDLEVVSKDPYGEVLSLTFVARLIPKGHPFKRVVEGLYLYGKNAEHGFVVMIPYMTQGEVADWWGFGYSRVSELTSKALDNWIQVILRAEHEELQRVREMFGRHQH